MRKPKLANEWLLWFFGSKDIGVAHTLSRTFFWSQNILWKEDLLGHHVTVFLGEKDSVINAPKVRRYLEGVEEHDTGKEPEQNGAKDPEKACRSNMSAAAWGWYGALILTTDRSST